MCEADRGAHAPSRAVSGALAGNELRFTGGIFRSEKGPACGASGARGRTPEHAGARVLPFASRKPLTCLSCTLGTRAGLDLPDQDSELAICVRHQARAMRL